MTTEKQFQIENIYVNECSFAAPTPVHRLNKEWKPSANLDLDVTTQKHADDRYEVELFISVDVKIDEQDVFKLTVKQAGSFHISGYDDKQTDQLLNSFCPSIIYPYARQVVAQLVSQAAFPQLHLAAVDFESRYQMLQEKAGSGK